MSTPDTAAPDAFGTSVAARYEELMVPMIFEPHASGLVDRLAARRLGDVLEVAAGTGIVTRKLATRAPALSRSIVATDISQPMLDLAAVIYPDPRVTWKKADAMSLPFAAASFDTVVCQFGAMFFADRIRAYMEARRVLRPGGVYVFNVWDRIENNEFVNVAHTTVAGLFPENPPTYLTRTPHGYYDTGLIAGDLARAGFESAPEIEGVTRASRADAAKTAARAYVQGTPLRDEILARDPEGLDNATHAVERALIGRFGAGAMSGRTQAFLLTVRA